MSLINLFLNLTITSHPSTPGSGRDSLVYNYLCGTPAQYIWLADGGLQKPRVESDNTLEHVVCLGIDWQSLCRDEEAGSLGAGRRGQRALIHMQRLDIQ